MGRNDNAESADTSASGAYGIRAVERVCDLIELLGTTDHPIALPELAKASGMPKSSVFRYLTTLESRRFVERVGSTTGYRLGSGILALRGHRAEDLVSAIEPVLSQMRDEFGETANLGFLDGDRIAYLLIVESRRSVRLAARQGDRDHVHCTALGKVILAAMPDDAILELIGTTYPALTAKAITDWPALRAELESVRALGYAIDDEENESGGRCVAVHIEGSEAAVSISAPVGRLPHDRIPSVVGRMKELLQATY